MGVWQGGEDKPSRQPVWLWQAELTQADLVAVSQQRQRAPFADASLLARWEAAWQEAWQRFSLAFADPRELFRCLRLVLGWPYGTACALDPLLEPVWREAVAEAGLRAVWQDVDPLRGQLAGPWRDEQGEEVATVAVRMAAAGWTAVQRESDGTGRLLEEISAFPLPLPGGNTVGMQLYYGGGNQWLAAGGSAVLLSGDHSLIAALRAVRRRLPAPLACALGLSQWGTLPQRWQRRQALMARYRLLRGHGCWQLPEAGEKDRCWPLFALQLASAALRQALQHHLQRVAIASAMPYWFSLPAAGRHWPGWQRFQEQRLALPCHAGLSDAVQKRIINRCNRWAAEQP
ncbi:MAG: DegT/DnrJ/EryC1/StrS family aminotransferase [Magnetococcales bacterium]|nr:DegT/DnrJ/EryC1/StrS family aminotransferase [Magnetococcales bacterium]